MQLNRFIIILIKKLIIKYKIKEKFNIFNIHYKDDKEKIIFLNKLLIVLLIMLLKKMNRSKKTIN